MIAETVAHCYWRPIAALMASIWSAIATVVAPVFSDRRGYVEASIKHVRGSANSIRIILPH